MISDDLRHSIANSAQSIQAGAEKLDDAARDAARLGVPTSLIRKMERAREQIRRALEELRLLTM